MTWAALLLADPSPCLRWLVLRDLLGRPDHDPEAQELAGLRAQDPLVRELVDAQAADGSWASGDGYSIRSTALALARLGYLGCDRATPAVARGAAYLFRQQREDGAWPLPHVQDGDGERDGYEMIPLQTAIPLRGLAASGYATDPRAERAYDWLLAQRLPDGAWPTGMAAGNYGYVAGYRRLAHSRWGCRANTTGALACLAQHPQRRQSDAARRGLDLLLGRETREVHTLGYDVARLLGAEPARGFITTYARFDLAQVLDLCGRAGITTADPRVAALAEFVRRLAGPLGLWEYPAQPQVTRWVTFDLLRSLGAVDLASAGAWLSLEPRTPFRPYLPPRRRY